MALSLEETCFSQLWCNKFLVIIYTGAKGFLCYGVLWEDFKWWLISLWWVLILRPMCYLCFHWSMTLQVFNWLTFLHFRVKYLSLLMTLTLVLTKYLTLWVTTQWIQYLTWEWSSEFNYYFLQVFSWSFSFGLSTQIRNFS